MRLNGDMKLCNKHRIVVHLKTIDIMHAYRNNECYQLPYNICAIHSALQNSWHKLCINKRKIKYSKATIPLKNLCFRSITT